MAVQRDALSCAGRELQPTSRNLHCGNQMAFQSIENTAKNIVGTVQDYSLFAWRGATNLFRPPIYWPDFLIQADIIGVGSASIVLLSGFFTGGVLALAVRSYTVAIWCHFRHGTVCQHLDDSRTGSGAHGHHGLRP